PGHLLEQRERHLAADDRRHLEQPLVLRRDAIDPCRQDGPPRGGHLDAWGRGRESIDAALAYQSAGLDEGSDALLQEERVALGPLAEERRKRDHATSVAE